MRSTTSRRFAISKYYVARGVQMVSYRRIRSMNIVNSSFLSIHFTLLILSLPCTTATRVIEDSEDNNVYNDRRILFLLEEAIKFLLELLNRIILSIEYVN